LEARIKIRTLIYKVRVEFPDTACIEKPIDLFGKTTLLTTHQFEKPKSLFEEKMQKQAFQLHEKAVNRQNEFNNEINNLNKTNLRRKSATNENADLAQTFVNQTQKPYQQEQRYAAHISLSGRQSTASCESGNSGSLDTENRQMIDQARYKHSQQRNKFKEAIDYLDHIFEDFQRESDLNQQQKEEIKLEQNKQNMPQKRLEVVSSVRPGNVKSAKEAFEKVAAALANERSNSKLKQQSYPLMVVQRSTQQQQFPSEKNAKIPTTVIPPQSIVAENGSNKNNLEEEEISVAETIVLPSKNTSDRLDFTRNWLTSGGSDMSGWAESGGGGENSVPKPYSAKGGTIQDVKDWDEHSLGSCSAEVAAINAPNERRLKQKEKQQQLILIKNQQQQKQQQNQQQQKHQQNKQQILPIRQKQPPTQQQCSSATSTTTTNNVPPPQISVAIVPAAVRPQPFRPQLGILPASLGVSGQMHKAPSIEQIRFLRAASQDCPPTSMASSIHSHEGFFNFQPGAASCLSTHSLQRIGFGGGAFHSYTPNIAQMQQKQISKQQQKQQQLNYINSQQYLKGSIQSLPDSALCTAPNNNNLIYLPGEVSNNNNVYLNNNNNYQQTYSQHLNKTPNNSDYNQQKQPKRFISTKENKQIPTDHSLAIDALVAELELDTNLNTSNDKRRSFPTIQTEVNNQNASSNTRNLTNRPAFETINQERINPSKVDAMAKMFDKQTNKTKTSNPLSFTTNGDSTTNWSSRRNTSQTIQQQQQQKHVERGPSLKTTSTKFQIKETPPTPPPHSSKHLKQQQQTTIYKQRQSPQFVKGTKAGVGVCGDRRYVVGNRQTQQNINNNDESEQQQQFNTSNGFYDNVHNQHQGSPPPPPHPSNYHHFRNEDIIDCSSMSSREIELPPQPPNNNGISNVPKTAGKRIGQLIKKLGNSVGGDNKQQNGISAVSTLSLNRSAHEQLPTVRNGLGVKEEILTKSNSLSSERWRSQAMNQQQNVPDSSYDLDEDKSHASGGLGNRLKQTILGGMVRRRVPT
uniref:WH2 domain-containing protein n=1 Tax=Meloidogyne floridensis TaxID=298350 RepID=A0A915NSW1_9BILA